MPRKDTTPDAGAADSGPSGGAQDDGGSPFKSRIKELQDADDATLEQMLAGAPEMDPSGSSDSGGADDSLEQEDDDAEGQRVREDDEEHLEGEGSGDEEGERGGTEDADDEEGEDLELDAEHEERERDEEVDADEEAEEGVELEDLLEEEGFAVVKLPARHQGDPDFELPIDLEMLEELGIDPSEAVERMNQMRNGYQYRAEVDAQLEEVRADQAELDGIQAALEEDPSGFLTSSVAPAVRNEVAENLVLQLDDDAFSELAEKVVRWARNPDTRTTAATAAENARLKKERDATKTARTRKQIQNQVREIGTAIRSLVPDTMQERTATRFVKLAAAELREYVRENELETLDPEEVPTILSDLGVLEDFNVSPNGRSGSASDSDRPKSRKRKAAKGKTKASSKSSADSKTKKTDVRERLRRRKRAASTPAGAGSAAASGFTKVPGESHEERMTRLRRHLGVPKKKGRR